MTDGFNLTLYNKILIFMKNEMVSAINSFFYWLKLDLYLLYMANYAWY